MTSAMQATRANGSIPMVTWGSWARENGVDQPAFRLATIAGGKYDDYIRRWALAAKRWNHPFFLRLDHEMNLDCCWPWAEKMNGNTPGSYVAMWRHVHDIFTRVGATNVTWVWCPNRSYSASASLSKLYPGDKYVDWTCLDGYNWGAPGGQDSAGWLSFSQLFSSTYRLITTKIAPTKPMMIGETASAETGGSKARWITDTFARLATSYPKIRAVVWFNDDEGGKDWPIESSAASQASFRAGISSDRYAANVFGGLRAGVIAPPGPGRP
jgi:beta-mannanase